MVELVLDIVVLFLLLVTIAFCWRLNNKILELKDSKKDLGALVKTFDGAIIKTHKSIADLKQISHSSSVELQQYVDKAGELISDLSFMTETATKLADRLEKAIALAREEVPIQVAKHQMQRNHENLDEIIANINRRDGVNQNHQVKVKSTTREELMKTVQMLKEGSK
jgi:hypothetical protein